MKTYIVKTQDSVNEMLLHSLMTEQFDTESIEEAKEVFDKEVKALRQSYTPVDQLDYTPSDEEFQHAIYCEITEISDDGGIRTIRQSDFYINPE